MTVADLAIVAGLVFVWGAVSGRLERFDVTAPIVFTAAGLLLTHGTLAPLGVTPSRRRGEARRSSLKDLDPQVLTIPQAAASVA